MPEKSELDALQAELAIFNEKLSALEKVASQLEGRHGEMVAQFRQKEADLKKRYPDVDISTLNVSDLMSTLVEQKGKLSSIQGLVDKCKLHLDESPEGIL